MDEIEFFKVASTGKLDPIEKSIKSLHFRRALLIKDPINETIWLINGTGVSKKTKQIAEKAAKSENSKLGFRFKISKPDPSDNKNIITELISKYEETSSTKVTRARKSKKQKTKKKSKKVEQVTTGSVPDIPKIPLINAQSPALIGDIKHDGPEISEFKIEYYNDDTPEDPKLFNITLDFLNLVQTLVTQNYSRREAHKKLNSILEELLDVIYIS